MKKKIFVASIVLVIILFGAGIFFLGRKEETAPSAEDMVLETVVQLPVDGTRIDLLEKMKIVKNAEEFEGELLDAPCDLSKAYELLNTMKGQDGAEVPAACQEQQITQEELLSLYLKELFRIEVKESAVEGFLYYANAFGIKEMFHTKDAQATNDHLISLAYACALYGLDDWENTKTVFQQMLESGYFNDTDITTFENAAMDDIFNYGTNKCPAKEVYDEYTGRTYYFVDYFGNSYNSSTIKNLVAIGSESGGKEILIRPYYTQKNMTADGTGILFTRYPGGQTYLYNVETQTMKYIDTVRCSIEGSYYMYLTPSDTLYYIKDIEGKSWIYKKDLKTDSEPEQIMDILGGYGLHVTNDEKYASIDSTDEYGDGSSKTPFVRIDLENKKVEVVQSHAFTTTRLPGNNNNMVTHLTVNPVYPELFYFAHDFSDGKYVRNVFDVANIMNVDTGEFITIKPGVWKNVLKNNLPANNIAFSHESWSENGEYIYLTNVSGTEVDLDVPHRGMVRVNKDGTHRLYITHPELNERQEETGWWPSSSHGAASGDDRYCVVDGYYISLISQETNQVFLIAYNRIPESYTSPMYKKHPYHAHPAVSRGDTYLVNWGKYYVPKELEDIPNSGTLGVAYFDFTSIDENEIAKGGEVKYNEYVSRLSYEGLDCESEIGTCFGKESIRAKAGKYAYFNVDTSIVDSVDDTVTITFDYYDNTAWDLKLIYTKASKDINDYCYSENGLVTIGCTNSGEWKKAEIVINGDFETSGKYGTDFKIGNSYTNIYIANIQVKKN